MKKNKTTVTKKEDIRREWHLVDVEGKILGSVASDIARLLLGKNKANYTPNLNMGDKVVVTNASKIEVTGKKLKNKIYRHSTGYPGALREESLEHLLERKPTEVLRRAVWGMLPKNKLRKERIRNLYIYKEEEHPHKAQLNIK